MSNVILTGDTSGTLNLAAPLVAGTNTQTLVAATGTLAPIVSGTYTAASGTSVDFTGIPSWVKRITVMFNGVSFSGSSQPRIQLGTSSGPTTTGYFGSQIGASAANLSSGFDIGNGYASAANNWIGQYIISNVSGNIWVASATVSGSNAAFLGYMSGIVTLGAVLDRVRITSVSGSDTFDAGAINILYE